MKWHLLTTPNALISAYIPLGARCSNLPHRGRLCGIPLVWQSMSLDLERGPVQAVQAYFHVDELPAAPGGSFCHATTAEILRGVWSSGQPRFEACGMIEEIESDTMWLTGDFRR